MMKISEFREWLDSLPQDGFIAVDDDEPMVVAISPEGKLLPEVWAEIGWVPLDEEEAKDLEEERRFYEV